MLIQCMQVNKCNDNRKFHSCKCLHFDMDCCNTSFLNRNSIFLP